MAKKLDAKQLITNVDKLAIEIKNLNTELKQTVEILSKGQTAFNKTSKSQHDLAAKSKQLTVIDKELIKLDKQMAIAEAKLTNEYEQVARATIKKQEAAKKANATLRESITGAKAAKKAAQDQRKATQELNRAHAQAIKINNNLNKSQKKSGGLFRSMTKSILTAGAAFFGAGAIISGVKQLVGNLFELSKQMQGDSVRSTVVFGKQLEFVQKEADKLAKKMGVTSREFVSMAAATADLLIPLDFTRQQAAEMSVELQGLTGALDEWTAGSVGAKDISEILTKAMLGENEQLKRLGIAIRKDTVEFRDLVKIKLQTTGVTKAQAEALATLELIQKKSTDAQTAYNKSGNKLLRFEKEFKRVIREKKENFIELFDVEKEQPNLYRLENKELNTLFGSLKNTNLSQDARNKLLEEVNSKYGKYLPNLLTEQSTLEDIAEAEKAINKQLRLKVIQQAFQEEINDLLKAELNAKEQLVNNEIARDKLAQDRLTSVNQLSAEENKAADINIGIMESLTASTLENNEAEIESTEEKFKRIGELYGIAFAEIEAVLNESAVVVETTNDIIVESDKDKYKELLKNAKEFNKQLQDENSLSVEEFTNTTNAFVSAIEDEIENQLRLEEEAVEESMQANIDARAKAAERSIEIEKQKTEAIKALKVAAVDTAGGIVSDRVNAQLDEDLAAFQAAQDAEQKSLEAKLQNNEISEKEFAKKSEALEKKSRIESAKAEKKKAAYNNVIDTITAVAKTFAELGWPAGIIPAGVMASIGIANGVRIASEPIPKFKDGGVMKKTGVAQFSEEGSELAVLPGGNAVLTPTEESFGVIPRGTKFFKHDSPETQAALSGGMSTEHYNGLIQSNKRIEKAISSQPKKITNLTPRGFEEEIIRKNSKIKRRDTYSRL